MLPFACVDTRLTDFRADLPKINVPTLVIHANTDHISPMRLQLRA
jgi:non-heme chloroperoxidase